MKLGCQQKNVFDDTALEFPQFSFWVLHFISSALLFCLGMRFALHNAPLPVLAYRLLRRMMGR